MPSILAEPRRKKQRMGVDPRNLQWRYSTDNFGAKLLGKMGWTEGKGIGKSEQGKAQNIRIQANYNAKGFGYEITSDKLWVEHNDDFAQILAGLNKNKEPSESEVTGENETADSSKDPISKEQKTERIRQRMKRKKFIRNLADCSESEKAGIFGSAAPQPTTDNTAKKPGDETEEDAVKRQSFGRIKANETHTISTMSLSDYFAQKMRQKSVQKSTEVVETLNLTVEVSEEKSDNKLERGDDEAEARRQRKAARKAERRRKRQLEEAADEL